MNDSNSLFFKVKISKINFEKFLKAKPEQPKLNSNWEEWWDSRKEEDEIALSQADVFGYDNLTNKDIINDWLNDETCLAFSDYNVESNIWHFGIVEISETYYNLIPIIAFVKSISLYKDKNSNDFAIIYEFLCSSCNKVAAYINFKEDESYFDNSVQIKTDINLDIYNYVEQYLMLRMEVD